MSTAVVDPTRLDEPAAIYLASEGYLFLGLGRLRCDRDRTHFIPVAGREVPAYMCGLGHEVDAALADTALVTAFWNEMNPSLRDFQLRVGLPENVRFLLVDSGVTAALDASILSGPVITSIAIDQPIL